MVVGNMVVGNMEMDNTEEELVDNKEQAEYREHKLERLVQPVRLPPLEPWAEVLDRLVEDMELEQ